MLMLALFLMFGYAFSLNPWINYALVALVFIFSISCDSSDETDTEKPVIDLSMTDAFPTSCATIYFDEPFNFKAYFSDNFALGSFSIDIHNNFDHHSHSTEEDDCTLDDQKEATNPYVFNDYEIPENLSSYEANLTIIIHFYGNIYRFHIYNISNYTHAIVQEV